MVKATEKLAAMGLSDAVRVFLMHVIAKLPFVLKLPNVEIRAAITKTDEAVHERRI